jgi:hypothetical protein
MSVYVIVQGKVENRGLLDQYVAKAGPAIKSHAGRGVGMRGRTRAARRYWPVRPRTP